MSENKSLPVLGTKKVFKPINQSSLFINKIEFVDKISNLDDVKNKWDVSDVQNGSIMAWLDNDILKISGNGTVLANEDCFYLFSGDCYISSAFLNVKSIKFNNLLDTSFMKNARGMFEGCLTLDDVDVSNWNTKNLENASCMFWGCESLKHIDVSNWNTENLRNAWGMFKNCIFLKHINLSKWNTERLQCVDDMFRGCECLKKVIIYDLKFMDEIEDKSIIEFNPSLNTMDTFRKGFKIVRNGAIITLTDEEMFDFRYLEQACEGRRSFEWFLDENESNEINTSLIKELMEDEEACYNVREEYYDVIMQDSGLIENECTETYINRFSRGEV